LCGAGEPYPGKSVWATKITCRNTCKCHRTRFHPAQTGHVRCCRVRLVPEAGTRWTGARWSGQGWLEVSRSRVVLLPYTAASVGVARRRIVADLLSAGIFESTAGDAAIVVTELITNALRHARPLPGAVVRVAWLLASDHVEVEVSDGGGSTTPTLSDPVQSATSGRGLGIVDRLSRRWGVRQKDGEMTVWAEVPVPMARDTADGQAVAPGDRARSVTHATSDA